MVESHPPPSTAATMATTAIPPPPPDTGDLNPPPSTSPPLSGNHTFHLSTNPSSLTSIGNSIVLLNLLISTKLTRTNYLSWQSQITPLLHGYDLYKFVNCPSPPPTILSPVGPPQINPTYVTWHKQDQLIFGWLHSTLFEPLIAQVVSCTTSSQLWSLLQQTFSASSRARQTELRRQLQTMTKGVSTCSDYLQKLRLIADELSFIGFAVFDEDPAMYALTGLGSDYNSFVVAATTASRQAALSFVDIHAMLLDHEAILSSQVTATSSLPSASNPVAFFSSTSKGNEFRPNYNKNRNQNFGYRPRTPVTPRPPTNNFSGSRFHASRPPP